MKYKISDNVISITDQISVSCSDPKKIKSELIKYFCKTFKGYFKRSQYQEYLNSIIVTAGEKGAQVSLPSELVQFSYEIVRIKSYAKKLQNINDCRYKN